MPMNSTQLAELVNRARLKPPHVVTPPLPPQRSVRPRQTKPAPPATQPPRKSQRPAPAAVPPSLPAPTPEHTAEADDFPVGWELKKGSWHFHRRFYAVFRRPMHRGEYSYLLHQIRRASQRQLLAGHATGRQTHAGCPGHHVAVAHHPSEGLAAAAGWISGMPKARQKVRPNEAIARAINAEPWEPEPGMVKKQCSQCRYWLAVLALAAARWRLPVSNIRPPTCRQLVEALITIDRQLRSVRQPVSTGLAWRPNDQENRGLPALPSTTIKMLAPER